MRLDAIFFDLYGTLLIYGNMTAAWSAWLGALHRWLEDLGLQIERQELAHGCEGFFSRPEPSTVSDGLTLYERRLQVFASELGLEATATQLRQAALTTIGAWQQFVDLDPDAAPVLSQLSQTRSLALISNFDHPPHVRRVLEETGLARHFQAVVVSAEVGIKKPDPEIFAPAIAAIGVSPERVAYVGDAPEDILAAQGAGMTPVRLQRDGDTESDKAADFRHATVPRQWTEGVDYLTVSRLSDLPDLIADV